jgi:hypothetical protein
MLLPMPFPEGDDSVTAHATSSTVALNNFTGD